jgi:predicted small secreted protein
MKGADMKKLMLVFFMMSLAGCNTVQGFGKDVKKAGAALEDAARR